MRSVDTKMYNTNEHGEREVLVAKQHPRSDKMYNVQWSDSLRIDDDWVRDRGFVIFVCKSMRCCFFFSMRNNINL